MFTTATLDFLADLAANNRRDWFEANRARYETVVREPALALIEAMSPKLAAFAPEFRADARKVGGSLMRIHRDTRFARDKTPYKTNIGIQFRHALGADVHAPGFYLHVANDECFLGAGCWRPAPDALAGIRARIADQTERWRAACDEREFRRHWSLAGEALTRVPRGFAADHPAAEDLRRKDFIALVSLDHADVLSRRLPDLAAKRYAAAVPLMRFLCAAVGVPY